MSGDIVLTNGDFLPDAVATTVIDQSDRTEVVAVLLASHLVSDRTIRDRFPLDDALGLLLHSAMKVLSLRIINATNEIRNHPSRVKSL